VSPAHVGAQATKQQTKQLVVLLSHFWVTVCKTVRLMLSDRCPVCLSGLSVAVHCRQTVGRIKMKLGMQVGLGPDNIVLDRDPAPPPPKGHNSPPPIFGLYLLRSNGCMDQDATWYGDRPRPRRYSVRWGPISSHRKGHSNSHFSAHVYCDQTIAHLSY